MKSVIIDLPTEGNRAKICPLNVGSTPSPCSSKKVAIRCTNAIENIRRMKKSITMLQKRVTIVDRSPLEMSRSGFTRENTRTRRRTLTTRSSRTVRSQEMFMSEPTTSMTFHRDANNRNMSKTFSFQFIS